MTPESELEYLRRRVKKLEEALISLLRPDTFLLTWAETYGNDWVTAATLVPLAGARAGGSKQKSRTIALGRALTKMPEVEARYDAHLKTNVYRLVLRG
jgi:hypothetical protein